MPDNNDKRGRIYDHVHDATSSLDNCDHLLATGGYDGLRFILDNARRHLSAAIDLLDNDRQPVDGSPPDAADPA